METFSLPCRGLASATLSPAAPAAAVAEGDPALAATTSAAASLAVSAAAIIAADAAFSKTSC